jgi:hypothetical protein
MSQNSGGFVFGRMRPPSGSIIIRTRARPHFPISPFRLVFDDVTQTNTAIVVGGLAKYKNQPCFASELFAPIGLDSLATYEMNPEKTAPVPARCRVT